jgi:hypothetical protein
LRALVRQRGGEELWKNCGRIVERFCARFFFHNSSPPPTVCARRQNLSSILQQFFSTILPRLEEFGASGLAWGRIVEGIIVEEL